MNNFTRYTLLSLAWLCTAFCALAFCVSGSKPILLVPGALCAVVAYKCVMYVELRKEI